MISDSNVHLGKFAELWVQGVLKAYLPKGWSMVFHPKWSDPYDIKLIAPDGRELTVEVKSFTVLKEKSRPVRIASYASEKADIVLVFSHKKQKVFIFNPMKRKLLPLTERRLVYFLHNGRREHE